MKVRSLSKNKEKNKMKVRSLSESTVTLPGGILQLQEFAAIRT
jgi:hypothetical protein